MRRRLLRVCLGLAVVVLALLEVQGLVQTLRAEARLRGRVIRTIRDVTSAARPRLAAILTFGGGRGYSELAGQAIHEGLCTEVEVFDLHGRPLFAQPVAAPVKHWPSGSDIEGIAGEQVLVFGPLAGDAPRVLTYLSLQGETGPVIVRLATPSPELAEDLKERRELLVGHALSLLILVVAAGLALLPSSRAEPSHRGALGAYEEAMKQLRERGVALDREHQEQRRRLADDLEDKEALARAGELTAGIAHEVRNGLATILGYARLLERSTPDEEVRETARRILEECGTLENVVRRFMAFVKRETLVRATFDLGRMLSRVVARETRARPGPQASIEGDFGNLTGDEEMLERAFENLVRNALEAAGEHGHVWIDGHHEDRGHLVRVRDDGPGMTPEALSGPRLFYTTKPGGLGLGLAIAMKVVGLHGGELRLSPGVPRGLVVTVSLPRDEAPAASPEYLRAAASSGGPAEG